ncbi:MAG TPA: GTPase [Actinomycetota bacterium]|nr:GTPase [Actinomycetota bacterium]
MANRDLGGCLEALERVAEAAERLGLEATAARETLADARTRLGFPGTAFVCALAGGTGAGKSSLLNALAGREVSRPGATRPVTAEPVAWVPADAAAELGPLLRWVGVDKVVSHHDPRFSDLCLLDLPDYDSVEARHRATVDQVLPRVDAVCWVLDPEKYNDRVLHEDYLRPLAHHADRAVFVVNRRDVIGDAGQVAALTADLRRTLAADGIQGRPVFVVSADPPDGADRGELEDLRSWLSERLQAKAVVTERLAADCRRRGAELARQAGLDGEQAGRPLVGDDARRQARQRAVAAASSAVDVEGVRRACRRRTLAEARAAGAGPLGRLLAVVARARGGGDQGPASARSIDPVAYARGWRGRSTLSRTVNPVHDLLRRAATAAPPALRAEVMGLARPDRLEERLTEAIDGAVAQGTADHARPPRSFLWPLIGVLQTLVTVAFVAGLLWYLTLYLAGRAQADLPDLPTVRDVPVPLLLVIGSLLVGWLLARLLSASARRAGRRWADRLTGDLATTVAAEVDAAIAEPLSELEAARSELLVALSDLRDSC